MTIPDADEKNLLSDIEKLRTQYPQTQDLYREVCITMFFRYGMTPTANKLYQLVRRGSMSAPAEALQRFWETLREKSRITVNHPDLPDALKAAAGELVATLWQSAQTTANDNLAAFRTDLERRLNQAESARQQAVMAQLQTQVALAKAKESLVETGAKYDAAQHDITALRATQIGLEKQLANLRDELNASRGAHDALQHAQGAMEAQLHAAIEARQMALEERAQMQADRDAARIQQQDLLHRLAKQETP